MPNIEIDIKPIHFITIGTIGPPGKRMFHLQAGGDAGVISFTIEKEQARALSEAIDEFIDELREKSVDIADVDMNEWDMDLREPIEPIFRISQMGLGYDEEDDLVILVAQEVVFEDDEVEEGLTEPTEPSVVRMWGTPQQMMALSHIANTTVKAGRADPKQNGRIIYYWT